ncbi:MAG: hypothetical protein QGG42_12670 [Phycisphaerae bacterium]|jgi:hypothetical protein|nr:hypothetical protein [Phycisphaerae bacterium]
MRFVTVVLVLVAPLLCFACKSKKEAQADPKRETVKTQDILYSQLDITENFGDNLKLKADDWIKTSPLNATMENPESMGLPSLHADENKVYDVAVGLSKLREKISIPSDGVYCPICHIANIDINKLHTPCPKCKRKLLKFGWD